MPTKPGRPKLGHKAVTLQLPEDMPERIDRIAGKQKRSDWVRHALEQAVHAAEMAIKRSKEREH